MSELEALIAEQEADSDQVSGWGRPQTAGSYVRDRARGRVPSRSVAQRSFGELLEAGHGAFVFRDDTPPVPRPTACKWCEVEIPPLTQEVPCEFPLKPWTGCRCNGCVIRENKLARAAGRPRDLCGADECRRKDQRERQRLSRTRRKLLSQK